MRTYFESQQKSQYLVREAINLDGAILGFVPPDPSDAPPPTPPAATPPPAVAVPETVASKGGSWHSDGPFRDDAIELPDVDEGPRS